MTLRQWTETDSESFAALNADPEVMEFFPRLLSREQSLALMDKLYQNIAEQGWGLWALEVKGVLAGFTGLAKPAFTAPFTPCVEVGWRLHRKFWGNGYAAEAARMCLRFGFKILHLSDIVSFTARINQRSERVMQRLGMTHSPAEDFEHPLIPVGHVLRPHVFYRIRNTPEQVVRLNRELGDAPE